MHAVLVPIVNLSADPENPDHVPLLPASLHTPDVPAPNRWGQASSLWKPDGKIMLWTRATQAELDAIAAQKDSRVVGQICPDAEADAMFAALTDVSPHWPEERELYSDLKAVLAKYQPGEEMSTTDRQRAEDLAFWLRDSRERVYDFHKTPLEDCVQAYREIVIPEETALQRQRGSASLRAVVAMLASGAGAAWLAARFGLSIGELLQSPHAMRLLLPLTTLHQDNFTGSNGSIGAQGGPAGRTMSDGLGQWFVDRGNCNITSNVLRFNDNTNARAYDSVMGDIDIQEVFCALSFSPSGPLTRRSTSSTNYIGRWTGTVTQLREDAGGANGQLGSNGTNAATNDVMSLLSSGSSHTVKVNGSTVVGPITDTSKATGRSGSCGDGQGGNVDLGGVDDWRVDVDAGGLTITASAIDTAEALGTAALNLQVNPSAVTTAEAFGSPSLSLQVVPAGVASAEAFGTPGIQMSVAPSAIDTLEAFGTAVLNLALALEGVASVETFGTPEIQGGTGAQSIQVTGIDSAEAFGSASLGLQVLPSGVATGEALGILALGLQLLPSGIASAETLGSPALLWVVGPSGIAGAEAFGIASFSLALLPAGIASAEAFPSPRVAFIGTGSPAAGCTGVVRRVYGAEIAVPYVATARRVFGAEVTVGP